MKNVFTFDGSKAARELGICYTPIREALEEEIAWYVGLRRKTPERAGSGVFSG